MNCPCCNIAINYSSPAIMSPFISKITNQEQTITSLNFCLNCGFSSFTHRYNDLELKSIYGKYRSAYYQKLRQSVEPDYTMVVNNELGGDDVSSQRQTTILDNLKLCGIEPRSILDYGGDRGQMIPISLINDDTYVYDMSDVELVRGVQRLHLDELKSKSIDLVMINHTLEHMPDFINNLSRLMKDVKEDAYIYIELPYDSTFLIVFPPSTFGKKFRLHMFLNPKINLMYFRFKRLIRFLLKKSRPLEMHEHINFFTKKSVVELMKKYNVESKLVRIDSFKVSVINSKVLTYIGQKKG